MSFTSPLCKKGSLPLPQSCLHRYSMVGNSKDGPVMVWTNQSGVSDLYVSCPLKQKKRTKQDRWCCFCFIHYVKSFWRLERVGESSCVYILLAIHNGHCAHYGKIYSQRG